MTASSTIQMDYVTTVARRTGETTSSHISINEAAALLGVKPGDVIRLIRQQQLEAVELVSVASLGEHLSMIGA